MRHQFLTRPLSAVLLPLALALTLVGTLLATSTSGSPPGPTAVSAAPADRRGHPHPYGPGHSDRPTVVLVHGALADSSGWDAVATHLDAAFLTRPRPMLLVR